jgi:hypothetical protein
MSYLDDLVKLNYLVPMRQAANSTLSNVNTFQSKDAVKDFLDQIQTNPDGTARPGGVSQLDLSKPENIQRLQSGTLSKLLSISGGQMDTPEMKGVQSISDRLLNSANISSEMAARTGTTDYQKGEIASKVDQNKVEVEKNRLTALGVDSETALRKAQQFEAEQRGLLYKRTPGEKTPTEPKNIADQQMQADWQTTAAQSKDPIISNDLPVILKALQQPGNILDNMRTTINSEYPKLPQAEREDKTQKIIKTLGGEFQTKAAGLLDEKNRAAADIKKENTILAIQKNWDSMLTHAGDIKRIKDMAEKNKQPIPTDDEAEEIARQQYMKRNKQELGIDTGVSSNPLELNIKPVTKRALGTQGKW